MAKYRIDFITHAERVYHSAEIEAPDDAGACLQAQRFKTRIGKGYRIWNGDRPVHTEIY